MTILILDNYDSFTHNLAQAFGAMGKSVEVWRNDERSLDDLIDLAPEALVVSPGPGGPPQADDPLGLGIVPAAIDYCRGEIPVLGVCLGLQVLATQLGATVAPNGCPVHGKPDRVWHDGRGLFEGLSLPFIAARYHSLAVDRASLPVPVTAWVEDGSVMAFGVPGEATWAVQFHPESFMTPEGPRLLENFLRGSRCGVSSEADSCAADGSRGDVSPESAATVESAPASVAAVARFVDAAPGRPELAGEGATQRGLNSGTVC